MIKRTVFRKSTRKRVHAKCGGRCAYCGTEITVEAMTVGHIHPRTFGGSNEIENLNPACRACNNYKGVLSVENFRQVIGMQIEHCRKRSMNFRTAERFGFVTIHVPEVVVFHFEHTARTGLSDFIRTATPEQKAAVYDGVMERASQRQLDTLKGQSDE